MTNPNLSHLIHAEPALYPQQESSQQQQQQQQRQPQHHQPKQESQLQAHQHQYQPHNPHHQYHQSLPPGQQPLPPTPGQHSSTGTPSSGLAPITTPTYTSAYPPPPSTASPAASATPLSNLATPAASPVVPHHHAESDSGPVPKGHAANTSLYQCADCLKRYSRPEHLQRHVATHTLGKRFICDICGKGFARADLLKRHRGNHEDDAGGTKKRRINASPGAGRVAHACQACAKARVKCEEVKPCKRCRDRNLKCEYASSEAGSAAAMHLLHLSAHAHSTTPSPRPSALAAPRMDPLSHNSASAVMPTQHRSVPISGLAPAAPKMTNPIYPQSTGGSPPILAGHPSGNSEAAQLPTPETMVDQSTPHGARQCNNQHSVKRPFQSQELTMDTQDNPDSYQAQYGQSQGMVDVSTQPFGDFLQHVLFDPQQQHQQQQMEPSRMGVAHGLNVLDFCDDGNLDMNELDFGMLTNWNLGNIHNLLATDPNLANYVSAQPEDSTDMSHLRKRLVSIWSDSPWRWQPDGIKDNINAHKSNLPLEDINSSHLRPADKVIQDTLENSARDRIMAIVLQTCASSPISTRVAHSFPSTEVLDSLMHVFLAWHLCQVSEFIHFGSFSMSSQCPEFLGMMAAAGAILTPVKSLRKFGYALQEAFRVALPSRFEDNNSRIQDASLVYALVLNHDIGLWSGNRRRMEIAECHLNIPVAMTRGRGRFQASQYPPIIVEPSDEGAALERKWKLWVERESWKRLIFHLYIRDAQVSMTSMSNPHVSYAELTLPVPESRELWFAPTAQEWKARYLERNYRQKPESLHFPSLTDLFRDYNILRDEQSCVDLQLALSIFLHGFASLIREWRQMSNVYRQVSYSGTMNASPNQLLQSRHSELVQALENLQSDTMQQTFTAQENVLINLLLMNLHVSLEDLELFAGKQGDDQARAIVPSLQRWAQEADSKRAIWHAGQILRWAREFPTGHLKDFYAVAVHHAALALWTWGIMTRALKRTGQLGGFSQQNDKVVIYIDMPDSPALQDQMRRFMEYNQGRPAIRGWKEGGGGHGLGGRHGVSGSSSSGPSSKQGCTVTSFIEEPGMCMDVVGDIFRANFLEGYTAPIVENLCHLIKQLGNAAALIER